MNGRLDPDQIPDDADGRDLARYVGEDVGRQVAVRVALVLGALCILASATTDASPEVRALASVVGAVSVVSVFGVVLDRARRSTQWVIITIALVACGGALATALVQHAG